ELLVGVLLVAQILFMVLNGAIAKKKGKAFPLYIGIPVWMATALMFIFVDSTTHIAVLIAFAVLIALGASAGNLATWSMLTDTYDLDEIATGTRREGIYSGMTTFLRKAASGFSIFIIGVGMKAFGFDQDQYNLLRGNAENFNPADYAASSVVAGIKWLFIIVPFVLLAVCLVFAILNKVNNRRYDAVQKGIAAFKEKGSLDALSAVEIADIETATGLPQQKLWQSGSAIASAAIAESDSPLE
ncbi:MAG: MFS transporter, partial [Christensenellales bacterium]